MSREEVLLDFTKKLIQCFHSKKKVRLLAERTITSLEQIPHQIRSLDFDFSLWLQALSKQESYGKLIQEKNMKLITQAKDR